MANTWKLKDHVIDGEEEFGRVKKKRFLYLGLRQSMVGNQQRLDK